jgi:hypothetical protein
MIMRLRSRTGFSELLGACLIALLSFASARQAIAEPKGFPAPVTVPDAMPAAPLHVCSGGKLQSHVEPCRASEERVSEPRARPAQLASDQVGAGRHYLIGVYQDPLDVTTPALMGAPWDYTINYSYQDGCAGCGVSGLSQLHGYPVIVDIYHVLPSYPSFKAAADGAYDKYYQQTAQALLPYAKQIYAIRIDSELNGSWSAASPFKSWRAIPPKTWIAGFRRLAKVIKATLPDARIIWNPNVGQSNPFPYYPGDDVVDLLGPDIYCDPRYSRSSHACWDNYSSGAGGVNLNAFAAFAKQHNKPIVIPEWGDMFGDGYMISQMRNWMDQNNVVAASYWDSGDALKYTAALPPSTTNQAAFAAAFGHRPYVGTYWPSIIPVPDVAQ